MLQSVLFWRAVDGFCLKERRQKCVFVLSAAHRRKTTPPSFPSLWHILSLWDDAEVHHGGVSWLVRTGTTSRFVLTLGLLVKWNLKADLLMAASKYYWESKLQIESWQEKPLTYSISKSCICANSSETVPEKMCCSNITHCLSVQKYWTKFSLWCKQRQFCEQFWYCTYLFIAIWPTIMCLYCVKWLRAFCLTWCKQRKFSIGGNGITVTHIAGWGLGVNWEKIASLDSEIKRVEQSTWEQCPFLVGNCPDCQGMGKIMVPFSWFCLSQQDPEGRAYATSF